MTDSDPFDKYESLRDLRVIDSENDNDFNADAELHEHVGQFSTPKPRQNRQQATRNRLPDTDPF